jgi:hypothetical protein
MRLISLVNFATFFKFMSLARCEYSRYEARCSSIYEMCLCISEVCFCISRNIYVFVLYLFVWPVDSHFFLPHHYQIVVWLLTTNFNSINQILWILSLVIFSMQLSFSHLRRSVFDNSCHYFFKSSCRTRQQSLFLQQRLWLLHCQRVCNVRCFYSRHLSQYFDVLA